MLSFLYTEWQQSDLTAMAVLMVGVQLLGIASAVEAVLKTRTAPGAVAWSISLITMPLLMVPLYWIFGSRKFYGYSKARRIRKFDIQELAKTLLHDLQPLRSDMGGNRFAVLERVAHMPYTRGNGAELTIDGEATFQRLFEMLDRARHYIVLEFYTICDDALGQRLKQRLLERAADGVKIHFLYDEIGSFRLGKAYVRELRDGGVDIRSFHTTKGRSNRFQLNFRNHRKIIIIDGREAMTGGFNVGDAYLGLDPSLSPWRDTNIVVRGPAVQCLQLAFLEDWFWACERLPSLNWQPQAVPDADIDTLGIDTLIVPTGPADRFDSCLLFFLHVIHQAQQRLWIVSPYFVPDSSLIVALQLAALRGVDVRVLLPGKADNFLVQLSSHAHLRELQTAGVKFYRYQHGFLHQKVMLVDDAYAAVGSANLDNRSFRLNFEITVWCRDVEFAGRVQMMLDEDFARSRLLVDDEFTARPWYFRFLVRLAHLMAPVQ